jgi:hypothetical protein
MISEYEPEIANSHRRGMEQNVISGVLEEQYAADRLGRIVGRNRSAFMYAHIQKRLPSHAHPSTIHLRMRSFDNQNTRSEFPFPHFLSQYTQRTARTRRTPDLIAFVPP